MTSRVWKLLIPLVLFTIPATAQTIASVACTDRFGVTAFSVTPAEVASGMPAMVKMTIQNRLGISQTIPYEIWRDGVLAKSASATVAANSSAQVSADWTAASGQHFFQGVADPQKTLKDCSGDNTSALLELNIAACLSRVAVTSLTLNPSKALPGTNVVATMTMKNQSASSTLTIPWQMWRDGVMVQSGSTTVAPGGQGIATSSWTAASGEHAFQGVADPSNTLNDCASDNTSAVMKTTVPAMVTELLRMDPAINAGATYAANVDTGGCGDALWWPSPADSGYPNFTVIFTQKCGTGGKAHPEVFKNFSLRNGWRIKAVERYNAPPSCEPSECSAQFETRPNEGSNNPYTKMNVWANPLAGAWYYLKLTVEGPQGTNPYTCVAGYDCFTGLPQ